MVYFDGGDALMPQLRAIYEGTIELKGLCNAEADEDQWEPVRQRLRAANNDLAVSALQSLRLFRTELK